MASPQILGYTPIDRWERYVLDHLKKNLPEDWIVITNIGYHWIDDCGSVRDGQCDFIVLVPNFGLAVLEVKGSKKVFVGGDGKWYRVDRSGKKVPIERESPPDQACRNMHNLVTQAAKSLNYNSFPGLYSWLVLYPNGELTGHLDKYEKEAVVVRKDLGRISKIVTSTLEKRGPSSLGTKFTKEVMTDISRVLSGGRFIVQGEDTEVEAAENASSIDQLTKYQYHALQCLFELDHVSISGPAGSGKTMLAIWALESFVETGRKAIYLCYNKLLAEDLRAKHEFVADQIWHVDKFFIQLAGHPPSSGPKSKFLGHELPGLVNKKFYDAPEDMKYDVIIVDEGQDFGEARLDSLDYLVKSDASQQIIFSDSKQNLFEQDGSSIPLRTGSSIATFQLFHNCRNTREITGATNKVCQLDVQPMPGMPSGVPPSLLNCAGPSKNQIRAKAELVWSRILAFNPKGGSVVLCPFRLENSCLNEYQKHSKLQLTQDLSHLGQEGYVFFATIRSFKGLEAEHVVLVDLPEPNSQNVFTEADVYVAMTRATAKLDIIPLDTAACEWFEKQLRGNINAL